MSLSELFGIVQPAWVDDAICAQTDPEAFYPDKGGSTRAAKNVCAACPVAVECLELALDTGERHGIWGGHSERARRRLTKDPAARMAAIDRLRAHAPTTPALIERTTP